MSELVKSNHKSPAQAETRGMSLRWKVLVGNLTTGVLALVFAVALAWSGYSDLRKRETAAKSLDAFEQLMKAASQVPVERGAWSPLSKPALVPADELAALDKSIKVTDAAVNAAKG